MSTNNVAKVLQGPVGYAVVFIVGAYIVYKVAQKVGGAAKVAADQIASPIANAYTKVFGTSAMQVNGKIVFADGSSLDPTAVQIQFSGNQGYFYLQGQKFWLSSHDANGNYLATPASAELSGSATTPSQSIGDNFYNQGLLTPPY